MMFPLVTECARDGIGVTVSCRVLGFSRQAYYRWLADPVCKRDWDDAHLTNRLVDAHADDPEFGYRLLSDEVNAAGRVASENRVYRLCRAQKLVSATVRRRRGKGRPGPAVHDDLVRREFRAAGPGRVRLTGITEHPAAEGKVSICAVKDVWSRRIDERHLGGRVERGYFIVDKMTGDSRQSVYAKATRCS
jgi:putative transposase